MWSLMASDWSESAAFNCANVKNYALDPGYHSCDGRPPSGLHRLAILRPVPYRLGCGDAKFRRVARIDKFSIRSDCLICLARGQYLPIHRGRRVLRLPLRRTVWAAHGRPGLTRITAAETFM